MSAARFQIVAALTEAFNAYFCLHPAATTLTFSARRTSASSMSIGSTSGSGSCFTLFLFPRTGFVISIDGVTSSSSAKLSEDANDRDECLGADGRRGSFSLSLLSLRRRLGGCCDERLIGVCRDTRRNGADEAGTSVRTSRAGEREGDAGGLIGVGERFRLRSCGEVKVSTAGGDDAGGVPKSSELTGDVRSKFVVGDLQGVSGCGGRDEMIGDGDRMGGGDEERGRERDGPASSDDGSQVSSIVSVSSTRARFDLEPKNLPALVSIEAYSSFSAASSDNRVGPEVGTPTRAGKAALGFLEPATSADETHTESRLTRNECVERTSSRISS